MSSSADVPPRSTKSINDDVAKNIRAFLRAFLIRYFYDDDKENGFNGTHASDVTGLSQSYLSDLARKGSTKKPGLNVVLRLREQTGASFEEITGHRPPLKPPRPFSILAHNAHIAEAAADEASSAASDAERPSSSQRTPSSKPPR